MPFYKNIKTLDRRIKMHKGRLTLHAATGSANPPLRALITLAVGATGTVRHPDELPLLRKTNNIFKYGQFS